MEGSWSRATSQSSLSDPSSKTVSVTSWVDDETGTEPPRFFPWISEPATGGEAISLRLLDVGLENVLFWEAVQVWELSWVGAAVLTAK